MTEEQKTDAVDYVTVEIYDQIYHLSGQDTEHIRELAARVDSKMRAVAAQGRTVDSLRVAVLAALNLADELSQAAGANAPWAMRAPPICAACWMRCCWKKSGKRLRKRAQKTGSFLGRAARALFQNERRKNVAQRAHLAQDLQFRARPILSAIETGLQSRWVVNAG